MLFTSPSHGQNANLIDHVQKWFNQRDDVKTQKKKKYSLITKPGEENVGDYKLYCWLPNGEPNKKFYDLSVKYYVVGLMTYDVKTSNNKILTVPIDNCFFEEQ